MPATVASAPPGVSTVPAIETEEGSAIFNILPATVNIGIAVSVMEAFVSGLAFGFAAETASPLMFVADPALFGYLSISLLKEMIVGFRPA